MNYRAVLAVLVLLAVAFSRAPLAAGDTVSDDFDTGISPALWALDVEPSGYSVWDVNAPDPGGRLKIAKPEDPQGPNQHISAGVLSRFILIGDFTASVDFDLVDYPHPGLGYNEALLQVLTDTWPNNFAVLKFSIRTGDATFRETFEGWSIPPELPFGQVDDPARSGRFEIRRQGQTMSALVDRGNGMELLGTVTDPAFGGAMKVRLYAAQIVRPTGYRSFSALDVRYDNFVAEADSIIPEPATLALLAFGALAVLKRRPGK